MKNLTIHSVPVITSLIWLYAENHTLNPLMVKGPEFLKFYLILILGTYLITFFLKRSGGTALKTSLYFISLILILGIIRLARGISLGKPVGFLIMILIMEIVVIMILMFYYFNHKTKV
ncbi:hypothetical protein [Chryseobacterium indologenes]|uniref:DUF4345 domain-containing protein n=1 Tax=Chryseobacterium indologenes TaxID=253 RepID=A0A0N0IVL5_CHRID|nr:hypothetical protein [Chryseobacterium indologenes]KPE50574.1 hypothetical protein AOB46_14440 [Chryseobacterium indologenes]